MAEHRRKLSPEEGKELTGYMDAAQERHVKTERSPIPRFVTHVVDTDVNLAAWGKSLPAGGYEMRLPKEAPKEGEGVPDELMYLWAMRLDDESARRLVEDAEGNPDPDEPQTFKVKLRRVDVAEGRPLLYTELIVWLAIQDADEDGDKEKADRIFYLAYGQDRAVLGAEVRKGELTGQDARKPHARKGEYQRRKVENTKPADLKVPIDPISRAIFQRHRGHVTAADYWSDKPKVVSTGGSGKKGRTVALTLKSGVEGGITAEEEAYVLSDKVSYWLDAVYSLAMAGQDVMLGSEILRQNAYENPYAKSMATTMSEAVTCLAMAKSTLVAVDASDEQGKVWKGKRPTSSTRLQSVLDAEIYLDEYEDEDLGGEEPKRTVRDFRIVLNQRDEHGSLLASLPLAKQAEDRDELITINPDEERFKSVKRLTENERRMWRYVLKVIKSKTAKPIIRFDTMFATLELDPPEVKTTQRKQVRDPDTNKLVTVKDEEGNPVQVPRTAKQIEAARKKAMAQQRKRMVARLEAMIHEKSHPRMVSVMGSDGKPRTNPRTGETMTRPEYEPIVTGYKITDEKLTFTRRKKN